MELASLRNRILEFLKKYRYVFVILLLGILLMNLPAGKVKTDPPEQTEASEEKLEERLETILSSIDGAGNVEVLLTVGEGESISYQQDSESSSSDGSSSSRFTTVLPSGSDRGEAGLIRKTTPEIYRGALVVCRGADNPKVKLAVTEAVAKVTGLSTDRISVVKMK